MNWRRIGLTTVVVGLLVPVGIIPLVWPWVYVPSALWVGVALYVITGQAITVSFHRELTHRSVRLRPAARYTEIVLAMLTLEGKACDWCSNHRKHHQHTDEEGDPHSPHLDSFWKGLYHAHCGWIMKGDKVDRERYVPDLLKDRGIVLLDSLFPMIAVASFILPGFVTLLFEPSWRGFFTGMFWGGFIRIFVVHHITWCINSVCHIWGTKPFRSKDGDQSVNNPIFGVLGWGEGWHRNHHAFQQSARIGLRWWEFDLGWLVIKFLDLIGQVEPKSIKVPTPEQIEARRV